MPQLFVMLHVVWRDVEPSGAKCSICFDACLLREAKPFYLFGLEWKTIASLRLCGSCLEAVRAGQ